MRRWLFAALAGLSINLSPARAADFADMIMPPEGWTITLKGNALTQPGYPGAKENGFVFYPGGGLRKAGTPATFSTPDEGIGMALYDSGWLKAGPVGKFVGARRAKDHPALTGLHDVDWTIEAGAFVEFWPMEKLRMRAELRHGFHGHHGVVADFGADWVEKYGAWTFSAGPRLGLASDKFMRKYFTVDAPSSLLTGLPAFNARGGLNSVGVTLAAKYDWTKNFSTTLWGRYDRLSGDAGASPIVKSLGSANQFTIGAIAAWSFDFKGF